MASIKLAGDTSGEVTISAPAVAGTTTLTLPATSSTLATQNALGVRNLIINGDMRIAQRGTSATGKSTGDYYTCDRWFNNISSGGTWTVTQDTDVPTGQGFTNSVKYQCTTADASLIGLVQVYQKIEGQMVQHLKYGTSSAETTTFSFWIKSNKTGTYIYEIYQADSSRSISKSFTIDSANTWEKKTITVVGDTSGVINNDNGEGYRATIWLAAGTAYTSGALQTSWGTLVNANRAVGQVNLADSTANYINITGVQLEVGDTATPFEHRPYDMELARCQRYFIKYGTYANLSAVATYGAATSTTTGSAHVPFPVEMRSTPTFGYADLRFGDGSNSQLTVTSATIDAQTTNKIGYFEVTVSGATQFRPYSVRALANTGYIQWSAEL